MTRPFVFPINCLNLVRRPDRRLQAWQQFRREGLEVKRIIAPDALPVKEERGWRNKGARACAAAHRLAWREARRAGAEGVIVFEDDVVLCRGFRERLEGLTLPEDWQVVYFGCVFRDPPEMVQPGLLRVTGPTWDTHAYLLRRTLWREQAAEWGAVSFRGRARDRGRGRLSDAEWWSLSAKERGARRLDTASDVILAEYHTRVGAYAVWPPMAWQVEGLSNNENMVRGNYRKDGTQAIHREAIRGLPGLGEAEKEAGRRGGGKVDLGKGHRSTPAAGSGLLRAPQLSGGDVPPASGSAAADRVVIGKRAGEEGDREERGHSAQSGDAHRSPEPAADIVRASIPGINVSRGRGILLSPYSVATERMAWGQVRLLRRYNPDLPVVIYAQDYLPLLPWRGVAEVVTARGCHIGKDDLRWLNKLEALVDSPFEETLFFDCDMASTGPVREWFDALGTDDVTFWPHVRTPENTPDAMHSNHLNPHTFCPHYGVGGMPATLGGGHYFVRTSGRSQRIMDRIAATMVEAMESRAALYWKFAGAGNLVGDEPAASMAMVEAEVKLPPPLIDVNGPVGTYMPPWQEWREADFENGRLRFHCQWAQGERAPRVVHFAGAGKADAAYLAWLAQCCPVA